MDRFLDKALVAILVVLFGLFFTFMALAIMDDDDSTECQYVYGLNTNGTFGPVLVCEDQ